MMGAKFTPEMFSALPSNASIVVGDTAVIIGGS